MNRKTIFLKTAFLLSCLLAGSLTANAYTCEVDGIYYNITSGEASVTYKDTNYNSYSGSIVIPDTVTYNGKAYPVTSIAYQAFYKCASLTVVTIPNSVTTIGSRAFSGCTNLISANIGNSVTIIYDDAFMNCSGLTRVNITNLESWCKIRFMGSESNPLYYAHHFYLNGSEVTYLIVPDSITEINNYVFENCSGLTNVTIGNSVTTIGSRAFSGCTNLTSANIGNSVTTIGDGAFRGCSSLTNVNLGNAVKTIGGSWSESGFAFANCTSLTSITIPNSVTSIGWYAFYGCTSLTSVTMGNSVNTIGKYAFADCSSLTRVDITDLEAWCNISFYCNNNSDYTSNPLYYAHQLYLNGTLVTDLIIPNSVTEIKQFAFYNCSVTSVEIPKSVSYIGNRAFSGCSPTQLVWNARNCGSIGSMTTSNITQVTIGSEVEVLPNQFVKGSQIASVDIPNSVTTVGSYAFYQCSDLTNVTIPNSVTTIGNYAFGNCSGLMSVSIPNSVAAIDSYAFENCSGLMSVSIPNSVTSIGDHAFSGCSGMTSVTIGNSVTTISAHAFSYCISLKGNLVIPNSVTTIGSYAFYQCSSLTSVSIGNSVTTIVDNAFMNCSGLTSVTIPNSVTSIGGWAFRYCRGLTNVVIVGEGECVWNGNGSLSDYAKTLIIGSGITAIKGLKYAPDIIYCNAEVPPVCDDNTFTSYSGILHVPSSSMVAYFTAEYWQNFVDLQADIEPNSKVMLSQKELNINLGDTLQLSAVVNPAGSTLVWDSLNSDVATVNENGLLTAVGLGECDIIAHLSPNFLVADTCHVTVTPGEITLTLSDESLTMEIGDEATLTLTINNATLTPVWTSSDEGVATVSANGVVRAIGNGECDITATVLDETATCHVTVGGQVVITLDQMSVNVAVGSIVALYPSATPDVELELAVTSSDPTVAIARVVNRANGASAAPALVGTKMIQVIGIKDGRATITVGSADGSAIPATAIVTVGAGGSIPGDVDGDGRVNIDDVTTLIQMLLSGGTNDSAADIDGNGKVNIDDVTTLINILLGY